MADDCGAVCKCEAKVMNSHGKPDLHKAKVTSSNFSWRQQVGQDSMAVWPDSVSQSDIAARVEISIWWAPPSSSSASHFACSDCGYQNCNCIQYFKKGGLLREIVVVVVRDIYVRAVIWMQPLLLLVFLCFLHLLLPLPLHSLPLCTVFAWSCHEHSMSSRTRLKICLCSQTSKVS